MVKATFEYEGNIGLLTLITHFGDTFLISCVKHEDELFRLGGTAINEVSTHEGVILNLDKSIYRYWRPLSLFKAFRSEENTFEGVGLLSNEQWDASDLHCYVTESYGLDMEGNQPGWMISKSPIKDANYLFVNLDVLDGGGNLVKRYRVSPFTGQHRIMENCNV